MLIGTLTCRRSEEKLKQARAALGQAAVHLIRINSLKGDPAAVLGYERIWRLPLPGCLPSGGAGEPPSRPPVPTAVRDSENINVHVCDTSDPLTKTDQHDSLCFENAAGLRLARDQGSRYVCVYVTLTRVYVADEGACA